MTPATSPEPPLSRPRATGPAALALLAAAVAALALIPGFVDHGVWSQGEIGALQRAQAALGAALSGLERSPWLPDALRTQALALLGDPAAIRLPGAIASCGLVGLAAGLARALGFPPAIALLAGGFALAFPLTLTQGRLALGDPVGELCSALAAVLLAAATSSPRLPRALALALAGLAALALALLSSGLWLGVVLPLAVAALHPGTPDMSDRACSHEHAQTNMSLKPPRPPLRRLRLVLVALALAGAGLVAWLVYHQGDGYIPLLGAAKDTALRERPHMRGFHAALEDCGYQLYPWLPLVLLGVLQAGRARWPALWLALGLAMASAWSLVYGARAVPLTVPAAVLAAAAFARLTGPRAPRAARRLVLVLALAGLWIFAKDARRTPSRIGVPLLPAKGEHTYPADELGARDLLAGLAGAGALALALSYLLSAPGPNGHVSSPIFARIDRARARLPAWLPAAVALACLARQTWLYGHVLVPRTSEQFSLLRPLARHREWANAGALPPALGIHRITDPGLDLYGPSTEQRLPLTTRDMVTTLLRKPEPAAALIRLSELAPLFQSARAAGFPLHVLDRSSRDAVLVANTLPSGVSDDNPIRRVVFDEPPKLAHETLVRFEDVVEIIGWEWDEPVVRGREVELRVVLRALRPLPSGAKITVRLQRGKLSRINPLPHVLVENIYPPQYWRAGDYLLHRFRVRVPALEVVPGAHEVVVGLRRSENTNFKISVPEGESGEHGVRVFSGAHEFAVVGEVEVW